MTCRSTELFLCGVGVLALAVLAFRVLLNVYRRFIVPAKDPKSYGKWAIITGSTAGIGREYAEYLAQIGMSILVISRSEDKLIEQKKEIETNFHATVRYLAYDYTDMGKAREEFYQKFNEECQMMDKDGGVGILINNVGIANQYPQRLMELTDKECSDMINCNIDSTIFMTRAVLKFMEPKDCGAIINVSSGSGNLPAPYISIYSATKSFITQFSRSVHLEYLRTGIDILAVMPLYVVSNKYRKTKGTLFAPMPIALVKGTFAQLGKKYFWQVNGYWFHTFLQTLSFMNPYSAMNSLKRCEDHRRKYQEKLAKKEKAKKSD